MNSFDSKTWEDEERLGYLAMEFRSTRDLTKRQVIADEYSRTIDRLISSGAWEESPSPEDQLPDAWMPQSFVHYWLR